MKKLAAMILTLALCVGLLSVAALAADPALTVETVTAQPGETVELAVALSGSKGVGGYQGAVRYDPTVLELVGGEGGPSYAGLDFSMSTQTAMFLAFTMGSGVSGDGVLFTLSFRVRDAAPAGASEVTVDELIFLDRDLRQYDVTAVAGGVTVGSAAGSEPAPTAVPTQPAVSAATPAAAPTAAPERTADPARTAAPTAAPAATPSPGRTFSLGGMTTPGTAATAAPDGGTADDRPAPVAGGSVSETEEPAPGDETVPGEASSPSDEMSAPVEPAPTEEPSPDSAASAPTAPPEASEPAGGVPMWIWIAAAILLLAAGAVWLLVRARDRREDGGD